MPRLPGHGLAVPDMREARPLPWERSKTHAKPPRERLCACQGWRYGAGALSGGSAALGAWHRSDWERCIISREVAVLGAVAPHHKSTSSPLTRARISSNWLQAS